MKQFVLKLATAGLIAGTAALPVASFADYRDRPQHRQEQKNQWTGIGLGSAALGVIGLLNHNSTLATAGLLGAGYSAYRYGQDGQGHDRDYRDEHRDRYDSRDRYDRDNRYGSRDRYDRDAPRRHDWRGNDQDGWNRDRRRS